MENFSKERIVKSVVLAVQYLLISFCVVYIVVNTYFIIAQASAQNWEGINLLPIIASHQLLPALLVIIVTFVNVNRMGVIDHLHGLKGYNLYYLDFKKAPKLVNKGYSLYSIIILGFQMVIYLFVCYELGENFISLFMSNTVAISNISMNLLIPAIIPLGLMVLGYLFYPLTRLSFTVNRPQQQKIQ